MIFGEPRDIVVERIKPGGGEDARLPHRPAKHAPRAPGLRDVVVAAGEHAADRAAEAFRQRDRNEIEGRRELGKRPPLAAAALNRRAPSR